MSLKKGLPRAIANANVASAPSRYWQVAAGSSSRDYSDAFLRHGLAFVGDDKYIATIQSVRPGDVIVLRSGLSKVAAVGRVVERDGRCSGTGDKQWLTDFDGWNLPGYCFVEWHALPAPVAVQGLTRGTLRRLRDREACEKVRKLLSRTSPMRSVAPEPAPTKRVSDDDILEFLVRHGLRPAAADELTTTLRRIRLLAKYYYTECEWEDVREHETRSFLILPFLLALGWPEQRLKIELGTGSGGRIDVAGFRRPYCRNKEGVPNDEDCVLILEGKGFQYGLVHAPDQARKYAKRFPNCHTLIVSNGYCYKTYQRQKGSFPDVPTAYLNLLDPRDAYPLDPVRVRGCMDVLRALIPHE